MAYVRGHVQIINSELRFMLNPVSLLTADGNDHKSQGLISRPIIKTSKPCLWIEPELDYLS